MAAKIRNLHLALLAGVMLCALSCDSPDAPTPQGSVTFRFEPAAQSARVTHGGLPVLLDSVAVVVFRAGQPLLVEARVGAPVTVDPIEMTIPCSAEPNKRVSVELFGDGAMYYHGANEDVDVVANQRTDVLVDAYQFYIPSLTVTPGTVAEGGAFDLAWSATPAARTYRVQASTSPDFASIEWEQSLADTLASATLPAGAHYFRVAPATPFATGTFAGPEETYVLGGSGSLLVTGFGAPGVIPTETVSILGENLDYPGTQVEIGGLPMQIVSTSWGELVVRMPRGGTTNLVDVTSTLGAVTSPKELIALRVAYVTANGLFAESFADLMWRFGADIGWSGVVTVPIEDLDVRDMSVFDVIVVAGDTGTDVSNWGGGILNRATAITSSGAGILAIGDGGLAFLALTLPAFRVPVTVTSTTSCYAPQPNVTVFQEPYSVIGTLLPGNVNVCVNAGRALALGNPSGTNNYASTGLFSTNWVLLDSQVASQRYFYWGFASDPENFSSDGEQVMTNVMVLLHN